jgi:hypothetical protein
MTFILLTKNGVSSFQNGGHLKSLISNIMKYNRNTKIMYFREALFDKTILNNVVFTVKQMIESFTYTLTSCEDIEWKRQRKQRREEVEWKH